MFKLFMDINAGDLLWANVEVIRVGKYESDALNVYVEKDGSPFKIFRFSREPVEYLFKSEAILWNDFAVVGLGHKLHLIPLNESQNEPIILNLEGYFGYLYPNSERLFVASQRHLHALTRQGQVEWVAENIGIDGVMIERVDDTFLYGMGEFDPPNGWKPFRILRENGEVNWL